MVEGGETQGTHLRRSGTRTAGTGTPGAPATAGAALLGALTILVMAAPWIAPAGPVEMDPIAVLQPPAPGHPLGTDDLGRDVWARVLYGGRTSLAVGAAAAGIAVLMGCAAGALAGYRGGWTDVFLMRLADLFIAFPALIVLMALAGPAPATPAVVTIIIGAFGWMAVARLVRNEFRVLRAAPFVLFARSLGVGGARLMFRHLLPHAAGPVLVAGVLALANAVLVESAISYLGFGIQPPTPTWGNLLNQGQTYAMMAPWLVLAPGLALFLTLLALHLLADGLRRWLDPRGPAGLSRGAAPVLTGSGNRTARGRGDGP